MEVVLQQKTTLQKATDTMRKVPEVIPLFWVIKLLTTALGEVFSDFLVRQLSPVPAVVLGAVGFTIALVLQFSAKKYIAAVYWLAVVMVAIFGTMVADVLHIGLGIPYVVSTILFLIALMAVFFLWYKTEKTLSIHSIYTFRREVFYWTTVVMTFALGTATGDMTASTLHLGYFTSGVLFSILIAIPALGYWKMGLREVAAFWLAYILTRPLGASFADWLGRSQNLGGLGIGTGVVSLVLVVVIVLLVGYLSVTHRDSKK